MKKKGFVDLSIVVIAILTLLSCDLKKASVTEAKTISKQLNFTQLPVEETGINFQNRLVESPEINVLTYQYFHNGGGVCMGDINNDGLPDVYFTANLEPNILYLNKGEFKFDNISEKARVTGGRGWATGATMVDINNDGWLDIYVCKSGNLPPDGRRNKLYINNGDLSFTEQAQFYGLDDPSYSTQAYFLDFDKDGDLDLFLLNHSIFEVKPNASNQNFDFQRDPYAGDKLYRNEGDKFVDISQQAGIKASPLGYGLSASIGDVNGDNYPDIYVCNDYLERDYLYINNKNGTFSDQLKEKTKHISNFSMGSDIADINNDGFLDVMIADMAAEDNFRSKTNMSGMNPERFWSYVNHGFHYQYMINTLQLNNGNGTFSEVAQLAGVDKTDWSWAPLLADFNHDGNKDLFITNGLRKEGRNNDFIKQKNKMSTRVKASPDSALFFMKYILDRMPQEKISNYLFTNTGNIQFKKQMDAGVETPSYSNGAAYGDLDGDGDLDLVVNNIDHPAFIYRNDTKQANFVKIELQGSDNNKAGIGARVQVKTGDLIQTVEHYLTRGYLSSVENNIHIGVGTSTTIDQITVHWSDGKVSELKDIEVNKIVKIEQANATKSNLPAYKKRPSLVTIKEALPFTHEENSYDDFEREVLLPHKMSNLGPALAVTDVNGDGLEDFYVGGAINQSGALFIQTAEGSFRRSQEELWATNKKSEETVAYFFDFDGDQDLDLYVGAGGNEYENGVYELRDKLYQNNEGEFRLLDALPKTLTYSTGCVAAHDYDNDGDLDLFVGNRQTPGKYPFASSSVLLENNNTHYKDVTNRIAPFLSDLGMVTNAFWSDLDGDQKKELVLSGEWMPIIVLEDVDGKFSDKTADYGLSASTGWWFGMAVGDIDKDGDLDLIGGNLGLNYKYKASESGPFQIFSNDINKDGKNDIVLGYNEKGKNYPLRGKQCSSEQIPELKEKYPSYDLFARATVEEVYEGALENALNIEVTDFHSAVFINEGGTFKRVNFSHELQSFNWNDMVLMDVNNDGNLDLITAGNLHEAEVETPRSDAGNGLILLGEGDGTFSRVFPTSINWGEHNVKKLKKITINNKPAILIGNNNDQLELLKIGKDSPKN